MRQPPPLHPGRSPAEPFRGVREPLGAPILAPPDDAVFDGLRYAERRSVVIRGFGHLDLVGNLLPWPQVDEDTRDAYAALYASILAFLDDHVRGTPRPAPSVAPDRFRADRRVAALPAVPTPEELEEVAVAVRLSLSASRAVPRGRGPAGHGGGSGRPRLAVPVVRGVVVSVPAEPRRDRPG